MLCEIKHLGEKHQQLNLETVARQFLYKGTALTFEVPYT